MLLRTVWPKSLASRQHTLPLTWARLVTGSLLGHRRIFEDFQQNMFAFFGTDGVQQDSQGSDVASLTSNDFPNILRCNANFQDAGGFAIYLGDLYSIGVIDKCADNAV